MKTQFVKLTLVTLALFMSSVMLVTSIAEAASISSRVRILESKVYKNTKEVRKLKKEQRSQGVKIDRSLKEMEAFKEQVMQMIADAQKKTKKKKKRSAPYGAYGDYAYP